MDRRDSVPGFSARRICAPVKTSIRASRSHRRVAVFPRHPQRRAEKFRRRILRRLFDPRKTPLESRPLFARLRTAARPGKTCAGGAGPDDHRQSPRRTRRSRRRRRRIRKVASCIDAIAQCRNVVIKLGGAQQRVGPWEPPFHMHKRARPIGSEELSELLFRWYQHALGAFGPERCMFESNFPVDKECVSYRTLWNSFKRIAAKAGSSAAEKAARVQRHRGARLSADAAGERGLSIPGAPPQQKVTDGQTGPRRNSRIAKRVAATNSDHSSAR